MTKSKGCFITSAELEWLRDKYAEDQEMIRIFNHIDALEALIQEGSDKYENLVNETSSDWSDIGAYIYDSESLVREKSEHIKALDERINDLERIRDINKADCITMANEVIRLMRKVPNAAR